MSTTDDRPSDAPGADSGAGAPHAGASREVARRSDGPHAAEADPRPTLRGWRRIGSVPVVGPRLFSVAVGLRAPYFLTVAPLVREMRPGRCVVSARKLWTSRNHLGTFHAIAACNLAEMAMGMLAEATVPASHRWVPKAMDVRYVTISSGGLTATATAEEPDFSAITPDSGGREMPVTISLVDAKGVEVQTVTITIWVTARRKRS